MTIFFILQLSQGVLVKVFPSLIKRSKTHFHNLPYGASIILGNNGFIWICPTINESEEGIGGFVQNLETVMFELNQEIITKNIPFFFNVEINKRYE